MGVVRNSYIFSSLYVVKYRIAKSGGVIFIFSFLNNECPLFDLISLGLSLCKQISMKLQKEDLNLNY